MKTKDFYKGYEGEPEVIFTRRNERGEILEQVTLWEGFFSDMMDAIPLGKDGIWEGISVHYQFETGWFESSPWEYVDFDLFLTQMETMDTSKFKFATLNVFGAILRLVRNCKELQQHLFLEQD